jgi:hypothetical protein
MGGSRISGYIVGIEDLDHKRDVTQKYVVIFTLACYGIFDSMS